LLVNYSPAKAGFFLRGQSATLAGVNESPLQKADVIYRDSGLLAVNKPPAVPVHGSRTLEDQPETVLSVLRKHEGVMVHAIHRLDRPVSGVNLFTVDKELLASMSAQFEQRLVLKTYLAVVRGWPEPDGVISHPLLPPRDERKAGSAAREAVTRYERLATVETPFPVAPYSTSRYSLLALYPETGRRHQLRMHMKHISHHLIGDTSYGRGEHNRLFREQFKCRRLLLHSRSLEFLHPETGQPLTITAPLDESFSRVINAFSWGKAIELQ
jgi:tRNA pseudouridine65 synthase